MTMKTPAETTVLGPYPSLEQDDLSRILSFTRYFGRQARFARLGGGAIPVQSAYDSDHRGEMASMAAALFKGRHQTATDAAAIAFGRDYASAAQALHALYKGAGPSDTDPTVAASKNAASDAAIAQLDTLQSAIA